MSQSTGKIDFKSSDIDEQMNYIEVGAKGLNAGDLILCQKVTTKNYLNYDSAYMTVSQIKNVIYQSSDPAIASVNKHGDVTLKKTGDVCIAIKMKKDASHATYYFPLHVVKKNAKLETKLSDFDAYRKEYAASTKACKTLLSGVDLKFTTKNIAKQYKLYQTYKKSNMESQFDLWDPTRYDANNMLKVKSVKTNLTSGTIELKNKITENQLMGINYAKKGNFQAKTITVTAYLVSLNGEYGVQLMKPIPVKITFQKGSSKI